MKHFSLFVLLLAAGSARAAETLTLAGAVQRALAADPAISIASAERDEAAAAAREVRSVRDAQVTLNGSVFEHEEPMVVSPIHGFTPGQLPDFDRTLIQSSLTSTYLLWDGGAARARIRQADALTATAAESIDAARQGVIARTVSAYLSVITAATTLQAHDLRLRAIDTELARVRLLDQAGKVPAVETYRAEAARAAAEADRSIAAADLDAAERELARLTRLPPDEVSAANLIPPSPSMPSVDDRRAVESAALQRSVPVRRATLRADAQRAAVASAQASRKPTVNLAGSVLEFGDGDGDFTFEWNAGMQMRFSVLDGGAARARIARATAALHAAEAQIDAARDDVLRSLDRAFNDLEQATAAAGSLERAEAQFAEVARVERLRLDHGAGTQAEYLRAESDLTAARAALSRARHRQLLAQVDLARIGGNLDPQWIDVHFRSLQ
jgi:outer membrane protein TolC